MERGLIYLLAIADICLGFYFLYRSESRFGLLNYKRFIEREAARKEEATCKGQS